MQNEKETGRIFSGETLWRRLPAALLCRVDLPGKGIRYTADALFGIPGQKRHDHHRREYQTDAFLCAWADQKDLASYDEILFVSKSLGTVSAGWLADALEKEKRVKPGTIRHIFMTPLEQTFPYMRKENCIVISGELDHYLERKKLKKFCKLFRK